MDVSRAGNAAAGADGSADGRRRPAASGDAERRCPTARYTISRAVCNERQRRNYFECTDCKWSEINRERANRDKRNEKIRRRYGFL